MLMIIEITTRHHDNKDSRELVKITFDGRQQFFVEEDRVDPSNNTLDRNFSDCRIIKNMLEKIILATQKGEPIEFKHTFI